MPNSSDFVINSTIFYYQIRRKILSSLTDWLSTTNPTCLIHPHGFFVVLLQRNSCEEWRLHIWPRGPRQITGMPAFIHTHNCHVESRVLYGQLVNAMHEICHTTNLGAPLYEVVYKGDRYSKNSKNFLIHDGTRVVNTIIENTLVDAGCVYHVPRNAWHEAVVRSDTITVTIARMHDRTNDPVFLIGQDGYLPEIEFERTSAPVAKIKEILREIY
jgi:hypothetical protein